MSVEASIAVRDVTVTYPNGNVALHDANFTLGAGTVCALVGINGSGKSTLFKAIMGFVRPTRGSVEIAGMPVRAAQKKHLIAYVPRERLLVQADLYDAGWQQHPWGENVLWNLERRKLKVARDVPVHGVIEPFDQMVKTIKARPAPPSR